MKSGNLNFLEPSGPVQACNGTALPLLRTYIHTTNIHTYICIHTHIHIYILYTYIYIHINAYITHTQICTTCRHFALPVTYYKNSDWGSFSTIEWLVCLSFCGRMIHDELEYGRKGLYPVLGYCSSIWLGGWVQRFRLSRIKSGTYRTWSGRANHCMAIRRSSDQLLRKV